MSIRGPRVTYKQAQSLVRKLGMTLRKTAYGEYLVRFKGSQSGHGVYEISIQDALGSAEMMYRSKHGIVQRRR
jgi:hypothetical protein